MKNLTKAIGSALMSAVGLLNLCQGSHERDLYNLGISNPNSNFNREFKDYLFFESLGFEAFGLFLAAGYGCSALYHATRKED